MRAARERALARVRALLAKPRADAVVIALALLATSSALWLGLTADDYLHVLGVRDPPGVRGLTLRPWDLFGFVRGDPEQTRALVDEGVFPWWSDPRAVIAFFRPLSSLSHWLDYALWPAQTALIHLHSMLWFALLLLVVARVYRALSPAPWVAGLSLLLYALDDARGSLVGWIATRNLLVALAPALLALLLHHRARSRPRARSPWLAALALGVGLSGGEAAVQVCGYLVAYALFLDRGTPHERLRALVPYACALLAWRVPYTLLGYGAFHSGLYFDPGHEPLAFAHALLTRLPILLLAQFAFPFSDLWDGIPVFAPGAEPYVLGLAAGVLGGLALVLRPLWRSDPLARFWSLGALLAALPVCAGPLDDRLLAGPGIGGAALIALFLSALAEGRYPGKALLPAGAGVTLALLHGVAAPLLLPLRAHSVDTFERLFRRADASIPRGPEIAEQTLVLVNPPIDLFAGYFPLYREAHRLPRPRYFRWLATGISALTIERLDAHTLRVRPAAGFLANSSQLMMRGLAHPMRVGERVSLGDATFEVTALTRDLRPAEVQVRFRDPLESPRLRFLQWGKHEYVPFHPPARGETAVVPRVNMEAALLGHDPGA